MEGLSTCMYDRELFTYKQDRGLVVACVFSWRQSRYRCKYAPVSPDCCDTLAFRSGLKKRPRSTHFLKLQLDARQVERNWDPTADQSSVCFSLGAALKNINTQISQRGPAFICTTSPPSSPAAPRFNTSSAPGESNDPQNHACAFFITLQALSCKVHIFSRYDRVLKCSIGEAHSHGIWQQVDEHQRPTRYLGQSFKIEVWKVLVVERAKRARQ